MKASNTRSGCPFNAKRIISANKMAIVFLVLIVLELVLIGDQVTPVKVIKKKLIFKKIKKFLPLLALIKPKKKIILLPVPIPMKGMSPFAMHETMPMMDMQSFGSPSYSSGSGMMSSSYGADEGQSYSNNGGANGNGASSSGGY